MNRSATGAVHRSPPTTTSGRSASRSREASRWACDGETAPSETSRAGLMLASVGATRTSSGSPTTTGPGRPEAAAWNASLTTSAARSGVSRLSTFLLVEPNQALRSNSWNDSRPRSASGISPTNSTIAVASCQAVCTAIAAFAAPGPRVTIATPGSGPSRPCATAMNPAPPSCRHTMVSIGLSYSPSRTSR